MYGYSELTGNIFQTSGDSWNAQKSYAPPVCTFTNIANANVSYQTLTLLTLAGKNERRL